MACDDGRGVVPSAECASYGMLLHSSVRAMGASIIGCMHRMRPLPLIYYFVLILYLMSTMSSYIFSMWYSRYSRPFIRLSEGEILHSTWVSLLSIVKLPPFQVFMFIKDLRRFA